MAKQITYGDDSRAKGESTGGGGMPGGRGMY
jgi:hypothetical protein